MKKEECAGVVVIGGGGHAKVILDILLASNHRVVGFCDPSWQIEQCIGNIPCLGDDSALPAVLASGVKEAIVALGSNALRAKVAQELSALGFTLINAIHPSAQLSPSVKIGKGIAIMPNAVVNADTTIGDNAIINTGATVDHDCRIGNATHIAPGVHLSGYVTVGDRVLIGVGSAVGRGQQLHIGDGAIIGTGSVVVHDVPPHSIMVGNPARPLKQQEG
jgi:UDP-perosamine 4-acetyltransferase